LKREKTRKQFQTSVKSVRRGAMMSIEGKTWEREKFWGWKERKMGDGW